MSHISNAKVCGGAAAQRAVEGEIEHYNVATALAQLQVDLHGFNRFHL